MKPLANLIRHARKSAFPFLLLVGTCTLAAAPGFAGESTSETIQATSTQAGRDIALTLVVYNYSTPSDLRLLSLAFQGGQDRGLAAALSNTKAVGHCAITGEPGYDVAFIQVQLTPTGRRITFIASRPRLSDEDDPPPLVQTFDLAVGQFDLNDADHSKSTGFLYPASKLVIDSAGEFHYDLAGDPWTLINVLDVLNSPGTPA
jgi:hypothetical protein